MRLAPRRALPSREITDMATSREERHREARGTVLLCWSMMKRRVPLEKICAATGISMIYAENIARAYRNLIPEAREAFMTGTLGIGRIVTISSYSRKAQRAMLAEPKFHARSLRSTRAMLYALLALPEKQRDERWQGAKEALSWVVGLGGSVVGVE